MFLSSYIESDLFFALFIYRQNVYPFLFIDFILIDPLIMLHSLEEEQGVVNYPTVRIKYSDESFVQVSAEALDNIQNEIFVCRICLNILNACWTTGEKQGKMTN